MAIIKCEECNREISSRAASCPHCGCPVNLEAESPSNQAKPDLPEAWLQPQPNAVETPTFTTETTSIGKVLAYTGLALIVVLGIVLSRPSQPEANPNTSSEPASVAASVEAIAKEAEDAAAAAAAAAGPTIVSTSEVDVPKGTQWAYSSSEEGMSGKPVRSATVLSTNTIELDFPYAGEQHATLMLRRHPRWGNDVIVSIERGQLLCHSYGDCAIGVRFDDGKVLRFDGNAPADNSSEYAFIPAFSTFMKQLPKSTKVRIELQVYQAGAQVFEFDVSGFDASKFK